MRYQLWDTDIGRLIGVFDSEEEAMTLACAMASSSAAGFDDLTLSRERPDGSIHSSLAGEALRTRTEEVAADRERAQS